MDYTDSYKALNNILKTELQKISLPDLQINIDQFKFSSDALSSDIRLPNEPRFSSPVEQIEEDQVSENLNFDYPVIHPMGNQNSDQAIILLHGLNERNWNKYLPWAYRLATRLQRPVVLFPISFHMNRSPSDWSNPRLMSALLDKTRLQNHRNHSATFANLALSLRLTNKPERFFTSGSQSLKDILKLAELIRSGNHPLFSKGCNIDFFAYSIGAFLSQIMMLTYGDSALKDSRLFLFCGGAPFNRMNGISKLIMDEEAFTRLRFFYLQELKKDIKQQGPLTDMICNQPSGRAFRAMISSENFSGWRIDKFKKMASRISAVGLKKDSVIPARGMMELLGQSHPEVLDFPFTYTHENPFPLNENKNLVNTGFDHIFDKATDFLA
jgi:pimeloyl-ACP methyl ester carboxylesterase